MSGVTPEKAYVQSQGNTLNASKVIDGKLELKTFPAKTTDVEIDKYFANIGNKTKNTEVSEKKK